MTTPLFDSLFNREVLIDRGGGLREAIVGATAVDCRHIEFLVDDFVKEFRRGKISATEILERGRLLSPAVWYEFDLERTFFLWEDGHEVKHYIAGICEGAVVNVIPTVALSKGGGVRWLNNDFNAEEKGCVFSNALRANAVTFLLNAPKLLVRTPISTRAFSRRTGIKRAPSFSVSLPASLTEVEIKERNSAGAGGSAKKYHYVRAHFRVKNGKSGVVRAHYRGDPSKGVKLTSYKAVPR